MKLSCLRWVLQMVLCAVCLAINLEQDLEKLSEMLPGVYSNNPRHSRNFRHRFYRQHVPPNTPVEALTTMQVSAIYRPVDVTFLPECFNVYVEQTLYGEQKPHRQWLYSFSMDHTSRAIRLKVYTFRDAALGEKIRKNPASVKYLSKDDVTTRGDCDMIWRRLAKSFVGMTTRDCIALVNDQQVRISVHTTLTSSSLRIDEGWYNTNNGSTLMELEGPVIMTKIGDEAELPFLDTSEEEEHFKNPKNANPPPSVQGDGRHRRHRSGKNAITGRHTMDRRKPNYVSNTLPESGPLLSEKHLAHDKIYSQKEKALMSAVIQKAGFKPKESTEGGSRQKFSHIKKNRKSSPKGKTTWTIQTYGGVIDAMLNGHKIYFAAKTKRCFHDNMPVMERTTIGDYIDAFEIERDSSVKQPYKHIKFSFKSLQHTNHGFFNIIREVTVHRNGTVDIDTMYLTEEDEIQRYAYAKCKLFNQDTGKGDVRFFLDPYRDVVKLKSFGALRSALQKGKMVRMTTELSKCSGRHADSDVLIGGEFRGYDLGRNGKDIDVTVQRLTITHSPQGSKTLEEQHAIYQFFKKGEASIMMNSKHISSQSKNGSILRGFQKYKCEIDPNSSTRAISLYNS